MDGLSAAASAITVGSIALQLIISINKFYDFVKSVEDAPQEFRTVAIELKLLALTLEGLRHCGTRGNDLSTEAALDICGEKIGRLLLIVQRYEPGFATGNKQKRRWNSLKATFKANEIQKIQKSIEETKLTLLLALQISPMISRLPSEESILSEVKGQHPVCRQNIKPSQPFNSFRDALLEPEFVQFPHSAHPTPVVTNNDSEERQGLWNPSSLHKDEPALALAAQENNVLQKSGRTFGCGCNCHKTTHYDTPQPLKGVFGALSIEYPAFSVAHQPCHQGLCCRRIAFAVRIAYYFPQWLLAWRISVLAASQPLSPVQVMFKTARIRNHRESIFYVAYDGDMEKVKDCFDKGLASPHDITDTTHTSLLHFAISNEHLEFARFLIRRGADLHCESVTKMSPVTMAWEKILNKTSKYPEPLLALLKELDETEFPTVQNLSSLHRAVLGLTTKSLDDELQSSLSNVNEGDANGRTPLSWAASRSDFRSVRLLLQHGASADIPARDGRIPLHIAAQAGSLPCLKILMRYTARLNHTDNCGNTALHYTCKPIGDPKAHLRCAESLIHGGAQIDAEDITGKTPLRVCIESTNMQNALLFLDRGANMHACTQDGMTLLMAAVFYNRHAMLQLLIERGALENTKTVKSSTTALMAVARSDTETKHILQRSLDPASEILNYLNHTSCANIL